MEHAQMSGMRTAFHVHVPGKLRRAKNRIVGARPMPDDSITKARAQLSHLDENLLEVASLCQKLLDAASVFEVVPHKLSETLQQIDVASSPDGVASNDASHYLTRYFDGLKRSKLQLQEMQLVVQRLQEPIDDVRNAFARRDAAFQQQAHYDAKAKGLSETSSIWKHNEDKFERNVEKLAESRQHFLYYDDVATTAATDALSHVKQETQLLMSCLNDFCGDFFHGPKNSRPAIRALSKNMPKVDTRRNEQPALRVASEDSCRAPPLAHSNPRCEDFWNLEFPASRMDEAKDVFPRLLGNTSVQAPSQTNPFKLRGGSETNTTSAQPASQVSSPPLAAASTNPWRAAWRGGYKQVE